MILVNFSVRRPIATLMITLVVLVIGFFSYTRLAVDLMPDISFPIITIQTDYEGVSPQEIETLITRPIEEVAATVSKVEELSSFSMEGRSMVRIRFQWGENLDEATNDIRAKLDGIKDVLPDDARPPLILKFDIKALPVMWVGVSGGLDRVKLRLFTDKVLKSRFERIDGVAQAQIDGGLEREISVNLSFHKLQAKNVSIDEVVNAIKSENQNLALGDISREKDRLILRTVGKFESWKEIDDIVIKRVGGISIRIRDVGQTINGTKDVKTFMRVNGKNAILLRLIKQPDANTVETAIKIEREVRKIQQDQSIIKKGIKVDITRDTSIYIKRAISNVKQAAGFGAVIAICVLLFFLRNIRSTFIIAFTMVVSVVVTFIFLKSADFTLNMMTFGGLALGIGMLVDNSVVVIENIYRHKIDTQNIVEASIVGTSEVANAILVSTLTTIVVFIPLFFFEGISGIMFTQLAFMVSFSLIGSLITALTLLPSFTSRFLKGFGENSKGDWSKRISSKIDNWLQTIEKEYVVIIRKLLLNKGKTIIVFILVLVISVFLVRHIGFDFMPATDEGEVKINGDMTIGTNILTTDLKFKEIEKVLNKEFGDVIDVYYLRIGQSGWRQLSEHAGYIDIYLKEAGKGRVKHVSTVVKEMNQSLKKIKNIKLRVRESTLFLFRYMRGGEDRITLEILGHDLVKSNSLADEIMKRLRKVHGVTYLRKSHEIGSPEKIVRVNRRKAREMGLSVSQIGNYLKSAVLGVVASKYYEGDNEFDIRVQIDPEEIRDLNKVKSLVYPVEKNRKIPLTNLIHFDDMPGPPVIMRVNQQRVVYVQGGIAGRDTQSILTDIRKALADINTGDDTYIHYSGVFEEQSKAYSDLFVGIIMAVMLVYMVMAAQFESFKAPFVIMLTVPLAFSGVILVFFIGDIAFDVQAFIGSIMLTGIVVNNSIVLVDFIGNLRKKSSLSLTEAIIEAGKLR
ncbi:MAG: efflux RND transporter permease subunit, partial [Spirochaetota bacterium]|nr:efflux RND transporter permease subunit [Spirochaetota bacterium]